MHFPIFPRCLSISLCFVALAASSQRADCANQSHGGLRLAAGGSQRDVAAERTRPGVLPKDVADATDLMILSLSAAARVDSGARFQYYVQIADISYPPVEPKSVLLRVELPAGTSFIQAELAQGWSCDESGNVFFARSLA